VEVLVDTKDILAVAPRDMTLPKTAVRGDEGDYRDFLSPLDKEVRIDFDAPTVLRKWSSVKNERIDVSLGARPYLILDGTLEECIQKFMTMPAGQQHLYEIHTAPQPPLITAVLLTTHIVEIARLRDFP